MIEITEATDFVLYEDDHLFVVNKPPSLPSLPGNDKQTEDLLTRLRREIDPNAQLCHRLDKGTSGAVIAAKSEEGYKHVSLQFQHREVFKLYHALVEGQHRFDEHEMDQPLASSGNKRSYISQAHGKQALTMLKTLHVYLHYSLVAAMPLTGRLHQIRVHLAHLNAPLAGDTLYGGHEPYLSEIKKNYHASKEKPERPMMTRPALHAQKVAFRNMEKEEVQVEAPYSKDMEAFMTQLAKHDQ
jgi:23S rRNA pseudouridine955/2504/2580 synthase